jgi:hypothetical protein
MKGTKDNNQKLYKVRIYKDFEFPSFSIDQNNKLQDLCLKSLEEVEENFHKDDDYFEIEVVQELPFVFNKEVGRIDDNRIRFDINFFIREIAINDLEAKFGKLDYKSNPDIFDRRTRNDGTGIDENSPYHLKEEVDKYYGERVKHYCAVIENKLIVWE